MKTKKLSKRKRMDLPTSLLYSIKILKVKITFTTTLGEFDFLEKLETYIKLFSKSSNDLFHLV